MQFSTYIRVIAGIKMSEDKKKFAKWCIPVPKQLDDQVEAAVAADSHVSKSEYVRDAVRRLLNERKDQMAADSGGADQK